MNIFLVLLVVLGVALQICEMMYCVFTKFGATKQTKLSIERIVTDLGYTMDQYNSSEECKHFVTLEWCNRLRAD